LLCVVNERKVADHRAGRNACKLAGSRRG